MTRQEFDILTKKYNAGECTPEEAALIERWAALHDRHHSDNPFFRIREERMRNENRIWKKIKADAGIENEEKPFRRTWTRWPVIAACLSILILGGWFFFNRNSLKEPPEAHPPGIQSKNTTVSRQRIVLPDSSRVVLEPGSSIVVGENYGESTRTVYLTGEAFFEVHPNPQLPFLVYSGELITEVLGTSFRIRPEEKSKTIEVSVMTGKVSIYTESGGQKKKRNGVIITPNQKVVFDAESRMMRQDLVDIPEIIVPPPVKSSFVFDDTPVEEVLALMQKVYGVEIVIGNAALKRCVFTGDLNNLGLYEQLDYLCDILTVSYEIRGTGIFISGSGCG